MGLILLIGLVVLLLAALPTYPYSRTWGYRPFGLLLVLVLVLLFILFFGLIPWGWGQGRYPY